MIDQPGGTSAVGEPRVLRTQCCIAGGGPAGVMLGYLLARSGIDVIVLEKHADFLRDFRGDTVHPSTLEVMHELGLLDEFLARPHQQDETLGAMIDDTYFPIADFRHLPTRCKFIAFMPQWDFLNFLTEHARTFPAFHLAMQTAATGLIENDGRVVGVRATSPDGPVEIRAAVTVGADGRHSTLRQAANLTVHDFGAPIDVLWMRLGKRHGDAQQSIGHFIGGRLLVMIDRDTYWQCAYVIPKGGYDEIRARGLPALRTELAAFIPPAERLDEIASWDDVSLLSVTLDRVERWYKPGLLCIGDAAHAMSPIGGVGINMALQDAVAAANILVPAFLRGDPTVDDLARVQDRREFPTQVVQGAQAFIQTRIFGHIASGPAAETRTRVPLLLPLVRAIPELQRIPAYLIGVGVRPEHVKTPEVSTGQRSAQE